MSCRSTTSASSPRASRRSARASRRRASRSARAAARPSRVRRLDHVVLHVEWNPCCGPKTAAKRHASRASQPFDDVTENLRSTWVAHHAGRAWPRGSRSLMPGANFRAQPHAGIMIEARCPLPTTPPWRLPPPSRAPADSFSGLAAGTPPRQTDVELHLVLSRRARQYVAHETQRTVDQVQQLATTWYSLNDQGAAISRERLHAARQHDHAPIVTNEARSRSWRPDRSANTRSWRAAAPDPPCSPSRAPASPGAPPAEHEMRLDIGLPEAFQQPNPENRSAGPGRATISRRGGVVRDIRPLS